MRRVEAIRLSPPVTPHGFDGNLVAPSEPISLALGEILSPSIVRLGAVARRKRDALELLADLLAKGTGAASSAVLAALLRRERLGSTHIGAGIALPHGRIESAPRPGAAILRLWKPVDYGTGEGEAVDLLVGVVWPQVGPPGFVPTLARIWRLLRNPHAAKAMRRADLPEDVHCVFAGAWN